MDILLLVYVDDIIVCSNNSETLDTMITHLSAIFAIKDLGNLLYFLCIEAQFHHVGLFLSQYKYLDELLRWFDMTTAKPVWKLIYSKQYLSTHDSEFLSKCTLYQQMIGALQYVTMTRPDISFDANMVS